MLAGWPAQLAASTFNRLDRKASSSGNRAYCHAEYTVSALEVAKTIASMHCAYPHKTSWAGVGGWLQTNPGLHVWPSV